MWTFFSRFAAPKNAYPLLLALQRPLGWATLLLFSVGLLFALGIAPSDFQQGEVYRILFLHVPSAAMALWIYLVMALAAIVTMVWKLKLADMLAKVSATIGALFTLLTLVSGSLWGRPTWGTYWIWDARLTCELILLFVYLGIIALRASIADVQMAAKATGLLTLVGVINLPIIHYSVQWWHTLHQGATVFKLAKPSMPASMLWPLLLMLLAYMGFYIYLLCLGLRYEIISREIGARWLQVNTRGGD